MLAKLSNFISGPPFVGRAVSRTLLRRLTVGCELNVDRPFFGQIFYLVQELKNAIPSATAVLNVKAQRIERRGKSRVVEFLEAIEKVDDGAASMGRPSIVCGLCHLNATSRSKARTISAL